MERREGGIGLFRWCRSRLEVPPKQKESEAQRLLRFRVGGESEKC